MCLAINLVCQKVLYQNYQLINRLYQDSISDGLTKLKNKRFFLEQIEFVTELVKREKASIGLIFIIELTRYLFGTQYYSCGGSQVRSKALDLGSSPLGSRVQIPSLTYLQIYFKYTFLCFYNLFSCKLVFFLMFFVFSTL